MQVNKQNIKRPKLIEPFFNEELTPSNDFVTYIDCTYTPSNIVYKKDSVTSKSHNSKKALKSENYITGINNPLMKICPIFHPQSTSKYFFVRSARGGILFIKPDVKEHRDYYNLHDDFSIFNHRNYVTST